MRAVRLQGGDQEQVPGEAGPHVQVALPQQARDHHTPEHQEALPLSRLSLHWKGIFLLFF